MHNPCNPRDCPFYASGYCEYDFATGQIMPMDEEHCPLLQKEGEPLHGRNTEKISPNG